MRRKNKADLDQEVIEHYVCDCHNYEHQCCDICQGISNSPFVPKDVENSETFLDQVIKLKAEKAALMEALVQAQRESNHWKDEYMNASKDAMHFAGKLEQIQSLISKLNA